MLSLDNLPPGAVRTFPKKGSARLKGTNRVHKRPTASKRDFWVQPANTVVDEAPKNKNRLSKKKKVAKRKKFLTKISEKYDILNVITESVETPSKEDSAIQSLEKRFSDKIHALTERTSKARKALIGNEKAIDSTTLTNLQDSPSPNKEISKRNRKKKAKTKVTAKVELVGDNFNDSNVTDENDQSTSAKIPTINNQNRYFTKTLRRETIKNVEKKRTEDDSKRVEQYGYINEDVEDGNELLEEEMSNPDEHAQHNEDEMIAAQFKEDLANMPLSKVRELKNQLGIKLFNKTFFGVAETKNEEANEEMKNPEMKQFKRTNSKRPREISSKKPVSRFRDIFANEKKQERISIDPRFDSRYGEFNDAIFQQNYTHIHELQSSEMDNLRKELKTSKAEGNSYRAGEIKEIVRRMQDRERTKKDRDLKRQTVVQLKQENMKRMKEGLAPVFKTRAEVRRLQEERKKEVLRKEGNLEKHLERKEKKQKSREKKFLPSFFF